MIAFNASATQFGTMNSQPQQTSMFGQSSTPSLFGMNQTTNSMFGAPNTSQTQNTFGTQPLTFGVSPIFGNTNQQTNSLFGNANQNRFSLNSTPAFGSTLGQNVNVPVGTTIKFVPQTGTDTIMKNGHSSTNISIRLQCITCMREYESKSLEELRLEDYNSNRKGPSNNMFPTLSLNTGFSSTNNTFSASTSNQTSLFSTQNKMPFNSMTSTTTTNPFSNTLNKNSFFNSNTQMQPSLFDSNASTSQSLTTPFFNNNTLNTNSALDASKNMFGTTTTQASSVFSQNQMNNKFGGIPSFGAQQPTSNSLFSNNMFSTTQQPQFNTNSSANTNLVNKPLSFGNFSTTQNTGLGTSTSTSNLFGGTTNTFGSNTGSNMFGSNLNNNSFNFGSLSQPFQSSNTSFQFNPSGFGNTSFSSNLNTNSWNNNQQTLPSSTVPTNTEQIITRLQTLPYGSPSHLPIDSTFNINNIKSTFTTDPKTLNQYKINAKSQKEIKVQRVPASGNPSTLLFDGLDDESPDNLKCAQDIFQPRQNIKKLVLNKTGSSVLKTTIVKSSPIINERDSLNNKENELPIIPEKSSPKVTLDNTIDVINKLSKDVPSPTLSPESGKQQSFSNLSFGSEVESPVHKIPKCGVILTRTDYYTIPSLEQCDAFYNADNDTCVVDSFTVGRIDYGSIFWKGPLNIKSLNLDEIVHIRRKEVIVYPDDDVKPPVGEGLNKPAQVTLDQVWPIDKSTREFIKDPERLRSMKYSEKVESATVKLDAVFKEYRADTGSWVFTVKHFSKYGLDADDDEVDVENNENCLNKKNQFDQNDMKLNGGDNKLKLNHLANNFKCDDGIYKKSFENDEVFSNGFAPGLTFSMDSRQKIVSNYGNYENLLDDVDDVMADDKPNRTKTLNPMEEQFSIMRSALFVDNDDEVENVTKKCKNLSFTKSVASSQVLPLFPSNVNTFNRKKRNLSFEPTFAKHKANIYSVCHSQFPRIHFINGSNRYSIVVGNEVLIFELDLVEIEKNEAINKLDDQLFKNSSIEDNSSHFPPLIKTNPFVLNEKMDCSLNSLIEALYGELKEVSSYSQHQERILRILNWLFSYNKRLAVPDQSFDRIMHFLTTNELEFAITECINSKQPRLSYLISTASYCNKSLIVSQLDHWKRSGADVHINKKLLKIYILLSGQIEWTLSNGETINQLENLYWTQQLVLILLYNNRQEHEIIGTNIVKSAIDHLLSTPNNVEYHLLAQSQPWVAIGSCSDAIDSWFLHEALLSYKVIVDDTFTNKSDFINVFMASQVKNLRWALFFALHIKNNSLRLSCTKELLSRNIKQIDTDLEDTLLNQYGVNLSIISEAKLYHSMTSFSYKDSVSHLINCNQFMLAHDIMVEKVLPELVINEGFEEIVELISTLKAQEKFIPSWNIRGAGIYEMFIQLLKFDNSSNHQTYQQLIEGFKVHSLQCPTKRHILCQSQMARVANIIHAELNDGMYAYKTSIPDDYALIELRSNANKILDIILDAEHHNMNHISV